MKSILNIWKPWSEYYPKLITISPTHLHPQTEISPFGERSSQVVKQELFLEIQLFFLAYISQYNKFLHWKPATNRQQHQTTVECSKPKQRNYWFKSSTESIQMNHKHLKKEITYWELARIETLYIKNYLRAGKLYNNCLLDLR